MTPKRIDRPSSAEPSPLLGCSMLMRQLRRVARLRTALALCVVILMVVLLYLLMLLVF